MLFPSQTVTISKLNERFSAQAEQNHTSDERKILEDLRPKKVVDPVTWKTFVGRNSSRSVKIATVFLHAEMLM